MLASTYETCIVQMSDIADHRVIYMLNLHAHTNVPLSSARTWAPFHHPQHVPQQKIIDLCLFVGGWVVEKPF